MPRISFFNGIKINIYTNEHPPPHFHAIYGKDEAMISISSLEIIKGNLKNSQYKKIRNWAINYQNALLRIFIELNPNLK